MDPAQLRLVDRAGAAPHRQLQEGNEDRPPRSSQGPRRREQGPACQDQADSRPAVSTSATRNAMNEQIIGVAPADLRTTSNPCHPRNPWFQFPFPKIRVYSCPFVVKPSSGLSGTTGLTRRSPPTAICLRGRSLSAAQTVSDRLATQW